MLISEKPTKATILHENLDFLMAESKTKSQKLSPKKDTWVDRISDLPESLICHILSFLPIQEVVATSILSSRWQHLWTLFSRLDLDSKTIGDSLSCNQGLCKPFSFGHIVSTLLTLHRAPYLRTLRLKCFLCRNCSRLDKWIGNVVERNLEELDLEIYGDYLFWKLPQSIFSCKTLVVLNLNGAIVLDPPPSFQFPSLKILRLVQIVYRPDSVFRLLSGCPVLEELSFQRQALKAVFKHKICASTLKRLSITFGQHDFDGSDFGSLDYKLEINAPALEYFKFQGHLRDIVFLHKLDSLVQADVYISSFEAHTFGVGWEDDRHRNECCADRVFNFLAALYNVKLLSFSSSSLKCLSYGSACLSQFQNLVQLDFKVYAWTWHMLQALLQNAPNLEVLFVTHKSRGYLKHNVCWKEPPDDPNNLTSCLTSFCYKGFVFEHVLEFVKYILKEARVLKKATIHVRGHERKLKESIVKKISTFPRCSMTCLLTVN